MSKPIGIGSRFRALTGSLRGREGTVREARTGEGSGELWAVTFDGKTFYFASATLNGPEFQRLADAAAEPDPLFVEIAELEARRSAFRGGPAYDDRRDIEEWFDLIHGETQEQDGDADDREGLLAIVVYALAGIRSIDRRGP